MNIVLQLASYAMYSVLLLENSATKKLKLIYFDL